MGPRWAKDMCLFVVLILLFRTMYVRYLTTFDGCFSWGF